MGSFHKLQTWRNSHGVQSTAQSKRAHISRGCWLRKIYSQVSHYSTIRRVLWVFISRKHTYRVLDIKNKFGNALNKKAIYVSQLAGSRRMISAIFHLTSTVRWEINFAVGYLSQFMYKPTSVLCTAAKHVLQYWRVTGKPGIVYDRAESAPTQYSSDGGWGSKRPARKSITETVFTCAGGGNLWRKFKALQASVNSCQKLDWK